MKSAFSLIREKAEFFCAAFGYFFGVKAAKTFWLNY